MKYGRKQKCTMLKAVHTSLVLLTFLCCTIIYCTSIKLQDIYAGDDYIQITTADELLKIKENPDKNYILSNDIDLSDVPCESTTYIEGVFSGNFNGNNKTISGAQTYIFEDIDENSVVEKLNVNGTLKLEGDYVSAGLLTWNNRGTIKECSVTATGVGKTEQYIYGGMITEINDGIIENCQVELNFDTEVDFDGAQFGGIVCANRGLIKNSTISGSINADTMKYEMDFGGIACDNYSEIIDCTNKCNVTGNISAGGIVAYCGNNSSYIYNCNNYGNFDLQYLEHSGTAATPTGGIAGVARGCIIGCTNYGELAANDGDAVVGGIAGNNHLDCVIDSCINNGNISTNKWNSGGICAEISFSGGSFTVMDEFVSRSGMALIKNCTNYGEITANGEISKNKGILGYGYQNNGSLIAIDNCKSYTEDTEDELTYNDAITVHNSDSKININEDKLVLLYNEEKQITGDFSDDSVNFFCSIFPVSETGIVKGDIDFSYTEPGAIIKSSVVVAVDKNTGATDYCVVEIRDGGVTYEYKDGILTFSGNGALPYNENYDYGWNKYKNDTTKIIFEDGVGSIPIYAFWYFENLKEVEFADSVVYIGIGAFTGCKNLKNIVLPDRLYTLQSYVFAGTGIESITIPKGMLEIYYNVFENCNELKTVHFEGEVAKGIGHISSDAFINCPALEKITVPEGCYSLEASEGILYQNTMYGKKLLCYPSAKRDASFTLPSDVYYIPSYVINENAYLEEFYGGIGLKYVDENNFSNCPKLKTFIIPENVERFSINFDDINYMENVKNNSVLTISLGSKYVYFTSDNQKQVTVLESGQEAVRYKPVAPKKVTVTTRTTTEGKNIIKWKKSTDAEGYIVMRKDSKNGKWEEIAYIDNPSTVRYEDSDVVSRTRYYYTVKAYVNNVDEKIYSEYDNDTTGVKTSIKTVVLKGITSVGGVNTVTWEPVKNVAGYVIKKKAEGSSKWVTAAVVAGASKSSYSDSKSLTAGKNYIYTVFAMGYKSDVNGTYSKYGNFDKAGVNVTATLKVPSINSAKASIGKVTVKWNKINGADGYVVYRRRPGDLKWTSLNTVFTKEKKTVYSYTDTTVKAGEEYVYTVMAYYINSVGMKINGNYNDTGKTITAK